MAVEIAAVTATIAAVSAGVDLIDKIYYQVKRVLDDTPEPTNPPPFGQTIEAQGTSIVSTLHGQVQTITGADLAKLPMSQLAIVQAYEKSMKSKGAIWTSVYPTLALETNPVARAQIELQLKEIIKSMSGDLTGIIDFLASIGLYLDDHYLDIRYLVSREAGA
jgi:hypothetical protein